MLDQETMLVMTIAVHIVIALAMLIYWRTQKTYPGFGYWAMSNILAASMYLLIAARPVLPVFVGIVIGNMIPVLAMRIRYEGVLAFTGEASKLGKRTVWFFILLGILLAYFTYAQNSPLARLLIGSVFLTYYAIMLSLHMIKESHEAGKLTAGTIAVMHLLYCIFLNIRTFTWIIDPNLRDIFTPSAATIAYLFAEHLMDILVAIAFLMLNSQRMAKELSESQRLLENLAITDPLTGINNRRKLYELGGNEILRSRRLNHPFSVLMFDLDFFKEINDTYGHPAGDKLLVEITRRVRADIRDIDFFGRLGGDEFILLLPETSLKECYSIAERIRGTIDNYVLEWEGKDIQVSISIGITELSPSDNSIEDLIRRVDNSLYKAKQSGRNKTSGIL